MVSTYNGNLSLPTIQRQLSISSCKSEAMTFHSAQAHPDNYFEGKKEVVKSVFESTEMSRQDSGYEEGTSSQRGSLSTTSSRRQRSHQKTSTSASSKRPLHTRASRSSPTSQRMTTARPSLQTRSTTTSPSSSRQYQFFQFPSLNDPITQTLPEPDPSQYQSPAPPPTVHYWTSEETRRLEYAAIDAASRGVRGFVTKLLPDCILPCEYRRTKFHSGDDDVDSDAGSVRRYRLSLPAEKKTVVQMEIEALNPDGKKRPGFLSRLTSFGRR